MEEVESPWGKKCGLYTDNLGDEKLDRKHVQLVAVIVTK